MTLINGVVPDTSTDVATEPTARAIFKVACCWTSRRNGACIVLSNPDASTVSRYVAGGKPGKDITACRIRRSCVWDAAVDIGRRNLSRRHSGVCRIGNGSPDRAGRGLRPDGEAGEEDTQNYSSHISPLNSGFLRKPFETDYGIKATESMKISTYPGLFTLTFTVGELTARPVANVMPDFAGALAWGARPVCWDIGLTVSDRVWGRAGMPDMTTTKQ